MKIVIDIREMQLERVGVSVYANNVLPRIIKNLSKKYDLILIGSKKKELPINQISKNILYFDMAPSPESNFIEKTFWYYRLPFLLKKLKADLYFGNFTIFPFSKKIECKTVNTLHDAASISTSGLVGNNIKKLITRYFVSKWVNHSTRVICISEFCKYEFSEIFGDDFLKKARIAYHGIPDEFKIAADNLLTNDSAIKPLDFGIKQEFFICIGTISPKKNYSNLIDAYISAGDVPFDLVCIGANGFDAEKVILKAKHSIKNKNIHFLGSMPTHKLVGLLSRAKCFIFPSFYEGFGIPLLEAFYLSIPVLSSNATCLPEIAGDAAYYFDPNNKTEMKEAILKSAFEKIDLEELKINGQKRLKLFSWDESASSHIKVIEEALSE